MASEVLVEELEDGRVGNAAHRCPQCWVDAEGSPIIVMMNPFFKEAIEDLRTEMAVDIMFFHGVVLVYVAKDSNELWKR